MAGLVSFDVRATEESMKKVRELLQAYPKGIVKIETRAVNKIAISARTEVVREVRKELNVKAKELKDKNIALKKARFKNPQAIIKVSGRRIPLAKFGARQIKSGLTYKIDPQGGRKKVIGAFMATMPSGHEGAYVRKKEDGTNRVDRLPIDELQGPSVPKVYLGIGRFAASVHQARLSAQLQKELLTQVLVLLQKGK